MNIRESESIDERSRREGHVFAASNSHEAGRERVVRALNVPRGVRQALAKTERERHIGGVLVCEVGHPIVACQAAVAVQCKEVH